MMTFKELREAATGIGAVTNKDKLMQALPVIVEAMERIKSMNATMREVAKIVGRLGESAGRYALAHEGVFDDGLYADAKGVLTGDITDEATVYHLAAGYADPKRTDGDAMSQDFLETLPAEWTQNVLKLYTGGINRSGATAEQLAAKGLYRPAKNEWTRKEASEE